MSASEERASGRKQTAERPGSSAGLIVAAVLIGVTGLALMLPASGSGQTGSDLISQADRQLERELVDAVEQAATRFDLELAPEQTFFASYGELTTLFVPAEDLGDVSFRDLREGTEMGLIYLPEPVQPAKFDEAENFSWLKSKSFRARTWEWEKRAGSGFYLLRLHWAPPLQEHRTAAELVGPGGETVTIIPTGLYRVEQRRDIDPPVSLSGRNRDSSFYLYFGQQEFLFSLRHGQPGEQRSEHSSADSGAITRASRKHRNRIREILSSRSEQAGLGITIGETRVASSSSRLLALGIRDDLDSLTEQDLASGATLGVFYNDALPLDEEAELGQFHVLETERDEDSEGLTAVVKAPSGETVRRLGVRTYKSSHLDEYPELDRSFLDLGRRKVTVHLAWRERAMQFSFGHYQRSVNRPLSEVNPVYDWMYD